MVGQNPYEAPKAELDPGLRADTPDQLPTASRGARFLNLIIDTILSRIVAIVPAAVLAAALGPDSENVAVLAGVFAVVGFFAYYIVFEAAFGWTFAKLITGTRVVRADGTKVRVPQIIGRTLARFIPFEPFSVLFSDSKRGWHDSLSGTRVVSVRR
jgi:uncharacterized RDD family membrane protein YckC